MTIERTLRLIAGSFVLLSTALGHFHHPAWLLFTGFVGLNLLQSGLTNWCPMIFIACRMAVRNFYNQGKPVALEPLMLVSLEGPTEYQGDMIKTLMQRRGVIVGTTEDEGFVRIDANVPLAEMFGYASVLRSATAGKAEFTMEFARYAPAPTDVAADLVVHGARLGDRVRLGDTGLTVEVVQDDRPHGSELLLGFAKTGRDGMGLRPVTTRESCDLVITNALVLDPVMGVRVTSLGVREGRIVAVGAAGGRITASVLARTNGPVRTVLATVRLSDKISSDLGNAAGKRSERFHFAGSIQALQQVFFFFLLPAAFGNVPGYP